MALSNLIWWPWFGITVQAPVAAAPLLAGDRRIQHEVIRTHPPSEDEEEEAMIAVLLSRL